MDWLQLEELKSQWTRDLGTEAYPRPEVGTKYFFLYSNTKYMLKIYLNT